MTTPSGSGGNFISRIRRVLDRFRSSTAQRSGGADSAGGLLANRFVLAAVAFACGVLLTGVLLLAYFSLSGTASAPADAEQAQSGEALPSVRDLLDPSSLPYEESLGSSLDQTVKQVDYALLRTLERLDLPRRALGLQRVEVRSHNGEEYHFQQLEIRLGNGHDDFIAGLRTALATWVPAATLQQAAGGAWRISLDGVVTHALAFAVLQEQEPQLPVDGQHRGASEAVTPLPEAQDDAGSPDAVVTDRPESGAAATQIQERENDLPRLAIVIDDIGESMRAVERLVALEYPVTLSIWPRATYARRAADYGWQHGCEIMIHQPMEPVGYPRVNPGPGALFVSMTPDQIHTVLGENLGMVPHAVGINNHMGSRFTQDDAGVQAVVDELRGRKLFVLDSVTHGGSVLYRKAAAAGLHAFRRSVFLDVVRDKKSIMHQLDKAAGVALRQGTAIAIGHPTPETLAALEEWQRVRSRKIQIVSVAGLDKVRHRRQ